MRGRSPRTREGRIGPTAQLQWLVVSGQRRRFPLLSELVMELIMVQLLPEVWENSPPFWDVGQAWVRLDRAGGCEHRMMQKESTLHQRR